MPHAPHQATCELSGPDHWRVHALSIYCLVDFIESINYKARTEVHLFVILNRAEWRGTNLFLSVNKKSNYY